MRDSVPASSVILDANTASELVLARQLSMICNQKHRLDIAQGTMCYMRSVSKVSDMPSFLRVGVFFFVIWRVASSKKGPF